MSRKTIDYVTRDYRGYKEFMKDTIKKELPEWTDNSDTDMGMVIVDSLAYGLDILTYYQENALRESLLTTAKTKRGVLQGASFLGYKPEEQKPAVGELVIKKKEDYLMTDCYVPLTASKFGDLVVFEASETVVIPAGEMTGKVPIIQGLTEVGEIVGTSNGMPNQRFTLNHEEVMSDSVYLEVIRNGYPEQWELTDSLLYARGDSKVFTVSINEEGLTVIEFGDGILGEIPEEEAVISVSYRYGGGEIGNLPPNIINKISDLNEADLVFIDEVYNEEATHGGADFEDLELIKDKAPKLYRIHNRIVSSIDAKEYAETIKGVLKAKAKETFRNDFYLYVLLDEMYRGNSEEFREHIKNEIDEIRVKNTRLHVLEAKVTKFDIEVIVFVGKDFDVKEVEEEVEEEIKEHFHESYFEFNQPFYATKALDLSYNIRGVRNAILGEGMEDIIPEDESEILTLENVKVEVRVID